MGKSSQGTPQVAHGRSRSPRIPLLDRLLVVEAPDPPILRRSLPQPTAKRGNPARSSSHFLEAASEGTRL